MQSKMTTKTRYKMYKKGKTWVIAGIVSGACVMSMGWSAQAASQPTVAASDEVTSVADTASETTGTTATLSTVDTQATVTAASATATTATTTDSEAVTATSDQEATTKPATDSETVPTDATTDSAATAESSVASTTDTATTDTTSTETTPADNGAATDATDAMDTADTPDATDPITDTTDTTSTMDQATTTDEVTSAPDSTVTTTAPTTAAPTVTADPVVESAAPIVSNTTDATSDTVATTRPAMAVTPVTTAASVTVPETRPDLANLPGASATGWTQPAVALVQAELTKPATMIVAHTKETPAIDLWMPNKHLQQIVLLALQELNADDKTWTTVDDITQEDLARLKKLIAVGHNGMGTYIDGHTDFSLVGLEHAVNLETIVLTNTLDVGTGAFYGDIADVTPLANLQHLTTLDLQHNRVTDVKPLANLQHLENLYLAYNAIQDFSPLNHTVSHEPNNFTYTGQFIFLDPQMINDADREGHLQVACTTIDGEVVQLTVTAGVAQPVFYVNGQHTYHAYFTGGNPKPDGHGGVYYTNIQDQKPGATAWPGNDSVNVEQLADYYYLTGVHKPDGVIDFAVIQPYVISHSAANVTVHYVDETGAEIAPSTTLKPGLVGEAYATTPVTVPNYVLQTTPENATGVYGETAIDVTYIYAEEEADTEEPGNPTPPGPTTPAPEPTPEPTPNPAPGEELGDDDDGNQSGGQGGGQTGDQGGSGSGGQDNGQGNGQGGNQTGTPGGQGTGDHTTGAQPGAVTPGADGHQPGATGVTVTDDDAGDVALPGMTTPSATGSQPAGQTTALAHSHVTPSTADDAQVTAASAATTLPQTDDQPTSAIWGVALLTGMLGWLGLKLKRKQQ